MLKFLNCSYLLLNRRFSTCKDVFLAQCLKERTLLQITGKDASTYLQGLVTNDMSHLQDGEPSMFTMFLNSKGRVLYDSIIYNTKKESTYYIECDKDASSSLKDHLLMYKVRRKVNVDLLEDELDVWSILIKENFVDATKPFDYKTILDLMQQNFSKVIATSDPRLSTLGLRVITPKSTNFTKEFKEKIGVEVQEENFYKIFRYKLGIGEGLQELPSEKCFPMEANGDYLNGISFHKGCYIGQELTARTHHTGVIRKRLMPLLFQEEIKISENGIPIFPVPETNKSIGKLQGVEQNTGVGLLRIEEALKAEELMVLNTKCKTQRPFWWPQEASKQITKKEETSEKPLEEEEEVKWFECFICKLREVYDVKTSKPKFTPFITFHNESYVVKDPFTPSEKKQFFILGSDCCICKKPVCQSNECSIFYKKRYCQNCASRKKTVFPEQLHSKIKTIV